MPPAPVLGWWRLGLAAVAALALLLVAIFVPRPRPASSLPVINAGDLVAGDTPDGAEVVIVGEWATTVPAPEGHLIVSVRGRQGRRVICHFEDVPAADRTSLDLPNLGGVYIQGRVSGTEDGHVCLRGCRLFR